MSLWGPEQCQALRVRVDRFRMAREPGISPDYKTSLSRACGIPPIPLATDYALDVNAASKGPRVNAVISGMTSNCLTEMFCIDVSLLSCATNGPFRYASTDA